ncbi:hypothetical protein TNCV_2637471 [Trichonephila clavipes]|nr:hypothetical protein TNCV_2637471 [Trichonephila clavipes]
MFIPLGLAELAPKHYNKSNQNIPTVANQDIKRCFRHCISLGIVYNVMEHLNIIHGCWLRRKVAVLCRGPACFPFTWAQVADEGINAKQKQEGINAKRKHEDVPYESSRQEERGKAMRISENVSSVRRTQDIADPLDGPLSHITDGCKDYEDVDMDDNTWSETESDIDYGCSCEKDESVNFSEKELEECIKFYSMEHTSKDEDLQGDNENSDSKYDELAIFNKFNGFVNYPGKITNDDELDEISYRNNLFAKVFSGHGMNI